ncbi:MAG TPA: hypothetical protein DEP51_02650 [Clostridiales bacterium]|nr:hypothetical protein [Clostridiales bacterium]
MKNKSWIIIVIMGIALTISIGYSVVLSNKKAEKESTVTTTSIIEMTATTATIKNTLKGTGTVEYKELQKENVENNNVTLEDSGTNKEEQPVEVIKQYIVKLSVEDKDFSKVKENQTVEVSVKNEEKNLNYMGKVKQINKDPLSKSTIDIEITNPDENLQADMQAVCTIIIEKAENVVALPIEAIQKDEENKTYVNLVQDGTETEKAYIKTGISDEYYVEIEEGLSVGDRVQIIKSSTTVVNDNEKNILKPTSEK